MTTYAKYHGAVFPPESQVVDGVEYGPGGNDLEGSFIASCSLPVYGTVLSALEARYLTIKTNEAVTLVIGLTDTNGDPVSTIGMTLEAVFESGTTEVVIPNADITKAATGVSLVATSALNSTERLWTYALRRTTDEAVLIRGKLEVSYAPNN